MKYCIIVARGGSKGIPRKNIRLFNGRPLIYYSISASIGSGVFDRVMVSSEDAEIQEIAKSFGADIRERPMELATDDIHAIHAVIDCMDYVGAKNQDLVCMLLPTSPLRTTKDIKSAIDLFEPNVYNSMVSVCKSDKGASSYRHLNINDDSIEPIIGKVDCFEVQRQMARKVYEVNGSIYISTAENLNKYKSFHSGKIQPFVMCNSHSVDINNEWDWKLAELIMTNKDLWDEEE